MIDINKGGEPRTSLFVEMPNIVVTRIERHADRILMSTVGSYVAHKDVKNTLFVCKFTRKLESIQM